MTFRLLLFLTLFAITIQGQSARSYYDEIIKAGSLDKRAGEYVCFDDDQALKTFFTFDESARMRAFFEKTGDWERMSPASKAEIKRGFISIRQYDHGVPLGDIDFYVRDGESYVMSGQMPGSKTPIRVRYAVAEGTLRYKKSVEILDSKSNIRSQIDRYGHCEKTSERANR